MRQIQIQLQMLQIQSTVIGIDVKREAGSAGSHRSYRTRTMNPWSSTGLHTRQRPQSRLFWNTCHRNTELQNKDIQKCFLVHIVNPNVLRSSIDYPGVAVLCCLDIVQESFLDSDCHQIARLPNCQIARCEKRQCCVMSEQVHLMAGSATEPLKGALELWHYIILIYIK